MTVEARTEAAARPRTRFAPFIGPGVLLALVYSLLGSWTVSQGFGGIGDDGGFIDFHGNPTSTPPPVVDVQGHPALWVYLLLAAILVGAAFWSARVDGVRARRRAVVGIVAAAAFITAVILVFSVVQGQLVEDAMGRGDRHPPILGNVSVTVSRMTSG